MDSLKHNARSLIKKMGTEVTLRNFEVTETSHGTRRDGETDETIKALSDPGSKTLGFGALLGAEVDADHLWVIDDREGEDIIDGGGDYASRIFNGGAEDGEEYIIIDAESSAENGVMLLECDREDRP